MLKIGAYLKNGKLAFEFESFEEYLKYQDDRADYEFIGDMNDDSIENYVFYSYAIQSERELKTFFEAVERLEKEDLLKLVIAMDTRKYVGTVFNWASIEDAIAEIKFTDEDDENGRYWKLGSYEAYLQ